MSLTPADLVTTIRDADGEDPGKCGYCWLPAAFVLCLMTGDTVMSQDFPTCTSHITDAMRDAGAAVEEAIIYNS
jgi:hypothetical protein